MLTAVQLGGFREDVVSVLGPLVGTARVNTFLDSLEAEIRAEAEAGAKQAIPEIRAEVRKEVRTSMIIALALGGLGAVMGGVALWRSGRRR